MSQGASIIRGAMVRSAIAVLAVWCGIAAAGAQSPAADAGARAIVERAHRAVAATGAMSDLRSLVLRGRVRIPQEGSRFDEGQVEIRILLPDQFLRVDTLDGAVRTSRDRALFARLMLGAAAYLVPDEKLVVHATGEDAFADTAAVDVAGPAFSARLVFEAPSMIPLRLTYFEKGAVSTVMSFADRRPAGAFLLPFRVSTQVPERVLETLMFDDVIVNPPLTKGDFQP